MRIIKGSIRFLSSTLLVALIVIVLAISFGTISGRYRTLTVLSGSMRPTMPEGSSLIQVPVTFDELREGDVVTYRVPEGDHHVVTHRVVEIDRRDAQPVIITKGDANPANDPWRARLLGASTWKTVAAVPNSGYVVETLRSPLVRQACFFIIPFALAALWLRDIWRPRDRRIAEPLAPDGSAP